MRSASRKLAIVVLGWLIALVLGLPLGATPLPISATPTDFGFFAGGEHLFINITGTVNLVGSYLTTNPDGSLVSPPSDPVNPYWMGAYQYMYPLAGSPTSGAFASYSYPVVVPGAVTVGDGINHFAGGGGNYDAYPNADPWAVQGKKTTDTTDPGAIRFGAVAGTFSDNPAPNSSDWFLVGYGGTFLVPTGGAHLYLQVADTSYFNDSASLNVDLTTMPEPGTVGLMLAGLIALGFVRKRRTRA